MNMWKFFTVLVMLSVFYISKMNAQDVWIDLPVSALMNKTEFVVEKNVLNTQGSTDWRAEAIAPAWRAVSQNSFKHSSQSFTLPAEILQWRLASIGGQSPPFSGGGVWPQYKWFTTSNQTWFQPTINSTYPQGNINFTFRIPASQFANHAFYAGNYSMQVTHNYGPTGFYAIEFSPETFNIILSVPEFLKWNTLNPGKYITISSLSSYRNSSSRFEIDLGTQQIVNSVDFKLWAKISSSDLVYKSSRSIIENRTLPEILLKSARPEIGSLPFLKEPATTSKSITVKEGNRDDIPLMASISGEEFKNQFFEAGTYRFLLDMNLESVDARLFDEQQTEVIVEVMPLSEINVRPGGEVVNFDFNTAEKYTQGETRIIPNQIRVSNNETFEVYVKSEGPNFNKQGFQSNLSSSVLNVGVEAISSVPLSPVPQKIITNGQPVLDRSLNMVYSISPDAASSLLSLEKDTYSINIIYSFTAL